MAEIHLHGALAAFHPEPIRLHVANPAEAVRALLANFPGIGEVIRDGEWHVVRGAPETGLYLDHDELSVGLGEATPLHFIPAIAGSRGAGKIILGAIIMIVAVVMAIPTGGGSLAFSTPVLGGLTTAGGAFMFGASMMAAGISQMMTNTTKAQSLESADTNKSYIFSGPTNRMEQGNVVPVVYGRCRVGSVVIGASISNDDIAAGSQTSTLADPLASGSVEASA